MYETIYCVWVEDNEDIYNPKTTSMFMTTEYETAIDEFYKLHKEMNGNCVTDRSYLGDLCKNFLAGDYGCISVIISAEGWIEDNVICYPDPTKPGQGKLLRIPF